MKNSEKKGIIILAVVGIVFIIVLSIFASMKKQNVLGEPEENSQGNVVVNDNIKNNIVEGDNIQQSVTPNETTSNQGKDETSLEGTEVSNINVEFGEQLKITGTAKNVSETVQGGFNIDIKLLDKSEKELASITTYLPVLQPGAEVTINASNDKNNISDPNQLKRFIIRKHVES